MLLFSYNAQIEIWCEKIAKNPKQQIVIRNSNAFCLQSACTSATGKNGAALVLQLFGLNSIASFMSMRLSKILVQSCSPVVHRTKKLHHIFNYKTSPLTAYHLRVHTHIEWSDCFHDCTTFTMGVSKLLWFVVKLIWTFTLLFVAHCCFLKVYQDWTYLTNMT